MSGSSKKKSRFISTYKQESDLVICGISGTQGQGARTHQATHNLGPMNWQFVPLQAFSSEDQGYCGIAKNEVLDFMEPGFNVSNFKGPSLAPAPCPAPLEEFDFQKNINTVI